MKEKRTKDKEVTLHLLESTYLELLRHPFDGWRTSHEWLYCQIRNRIAKLSKMDWWDVQKKYEDLAMKDTSRSPLEELLVDQEVPMRILRS